MKGLTEPLWKVPGGPEERSKVLPQVMRGRNGAGSGAESQAADPPGGLGGVFFRKAVSAACLRGHSLHH